MITPPTTGREGEYIRSTGGVRRTFIHMRIHSNDTKCSSLDLSNTAAESTNFFLLINLISFRKNTWYFAPPNSLHTYCNTYMILKSMS